MKGKKRRAAPRSNDRAAVLPPATERWARRLAADVDGVLARHPDADPEVVRLTLIPLESPPLASLNRSLRRGF